MGRRGKSRGRVPTGDKGDAAIAIVTEVATAESRPKGEASRGKRRRRKGRDKDAAAHQDAPASVPEDVAGTEETHEAAQVGAAGATPAWEKLGGLMPYPKSKRYRHVRSLLGAMLADAISQFCRISWNQAKHQYSNGYPKSVISVEDAIGSYFVVRALGAEVLVIAGRMEALTKAIDDALCNGRSYVTGELPRVVDADTPWSVSDIDFADEEDPQ